MGAPACNPPEAVTVQQVRDQIAQETAANAKQ